MSQTIFLLCIAGLALTALSVVGAEEKVPGDLEPALHTLNEAFTKNDAAAIRRLMTDDHVAITPYYGMAGKDDQIRTLAELRLTEYKAGKLTIRLVSSDVALITYRLDQQGTYKGKALATRSQATAVWVRRDGRWLETLYQETALEGP